MDSRAQTIGEDLKSPFIWWPLLTSSQGIYGRFLVTLIVNILKIGLSFVSGILIARVLGPEEYGNFNFLLGSFASIITLIDLGTANAFYTFLSQKKQSLKFYLYYALWLIVQFLFAGLIVAFLFAINQQDKVWIEQSWPHILLALIASFLMTKAWLTVTHAGESVRATIIVQIYSIALAIVYLAIVIILVLLRSINIINLFLVLIGIYFTFSIILAKKLKSELIVNRTTQLADMFKEFREYCAPLVIYSLFAFFYSFADVWLLQKFSGAVHQGYYSIGVRVSSVCLIATTSITKIFWKEVAEASERNDYDYLQYLYAKISKILCFVGAVCACFLITFSREILFNLLGPTYEAGWLPLAIMFFYPIHQALGQINGIFFYATSKTKLFAIIGVIMMAISIPITYLILAPASATIPGLGWASTGMAVKMVVMQIVGVNISIYFVSRILGKKLEFLYQFKIIIILMAAAFFIKKIVIALNQLLGLSLNFFVVGASSLLIYLCVVVLIMYLFPNITGVDRRYIKNSFSVIKKAWTRV